MSNLTTEQTARTATVTTNCTCEFWDEETDTYTPASECWGDCQSEAEEFATELISEWLTAQNLSQFQQVLIRGLRLGWLRRDGWKLAGTEPLDILRSLYLKGEFTIELTLNEGSLTAIRYSHDEPMGANFYFEPVVICGSAECEVSEGLVTDNQGVPRCDWHTDN